MGPALGAPAGSARLPGVGDIERGRGPATFGRADGGLRREQALEHARAIAEATELPVSADLENGFADAPEAAAEAIRLAAQAGLVGASIEDASGAADAPIYPFDLAVERVAAAVEAAHALPFPFLLTARAEGFLNDRPDLDDVIRRLQAFEQAGADVLFAPGLPDLAAVQAVCAATSKPVNFMAGLPGKSFSVAELEAVGVRRVSMSTSLFRAAMSGLVEAAREVGERGTFDYIERILTGKELYPLILE